MSKSFVVQEKTELETVWWSVSPATPSPSNVCASYSSSVHGEALPRAAEAPCGTFCGVLFIIQR